MVVRSKALKRRCLQLFALSIGLAATAFTRPAAAQTYYVSPTGSDNNSGTSASSPWQSLSKVDSTTFAPGSQILFQAGGNWYGQQLVASSSGTVNDPITYGMYGTGADPTFWGSVPLNSSQFQPVAGSSNTYFMPTTTVDNTWASYSPAANTSAPVTSVFNNGQFLNSAALATGQSTDSANISYVENNANSWAYGGTGTSQGLYINTGAALTSAAAITATVQPAIVYSNQKSNVAFENLSVTESAAQNGGYGLYAFGGSNVTFLNDSSTAAGKHAFAAIDTTNFLGEGLNASYLMPGQSTGGATAYVSYADSSVTNTTYKWINDTFSNPNGAYEGFYTHSSPSTSNPNPSPNPISKIVIQNMNISGGGGGIDGGTTPGETVTIIGGSSDGSMALDGNNWTVNGMLLTGPNGTINLAGSNNVVENTIINGATPNWEAGSDGAIVDNGTNNTIRYNTIVLGVPKPSSIQSTQGLEALEAAIGLGSNTTNTQIYANIIDTPFAAFFQRAPGTPEINAFDNLFANTNGTTNNPQIILFDTSNHTPLSGWPTSISYGELSGNPDFINAAAGDFSLSPDSIAAYVFDPTTGEDGLFDLYGNIRPTTNESLGAIEVPEAPPLAVLAAALALPFFLSRRTTLRGHPHRNGANAA